MVTQEKKKSHEKLKYSQKVIRFHRYLILRLECQMILDNLSFPPPPKTIQRVIALKDRLCGPFVLLA